MSEEGPMEFFCMGCECRVPGKVFDVTRAMEKVHFGLPARSYGDVQLAAGVPEVEIAESEGIGVYCNQSCRSTNLEALMRSEGVPLPSKPPDVGPIETCAICKGPVDMSAFHRTYSACELDFGGVGVTVSNFEYLAVICAGCCSSATASSAAKPARTEFEVT